MDSTHSQLILLMFLYFIQGLPYGFQVKFLPIYLHSKGTSLTQVSLLRLLLLPWLGKALWAPLVDHKGTKQKWLVGSILGLVLSCAIGIVLPADSLVAVCILLFLLNLFAAIQDIAVDSIAVRMLSSEDLGHGNSAQVVGYKLGSVFGGGILIMLMDYIGWRGLFVILTIVYMEAALFAYLSPALRHLSFEVTNNNMHTKQERDSAINDNSSDSDSCFDDDDDLSSQEEDPEASSQDAQATAAEASNESVSRMPHIIDSSESRRSLTKDLGENKFSTQYLLNIFHVPGTTWLCIFVLVYKLGEQGIVGMLPLFLVDHEMPSSDAGFWSGVVGQAASVIGSLLAGWLISYNRVPAGLLLHQLCLISLVPQGASLFLVGTWHIYTFPDFVKQYLSVLVLVALLLIGGMVTTTTFTVMMQCSKRAVPNLQATHYTTLATLEVLGKLVFMSLTGWLVDLIGYRASFLLFVLLSGIVVLWVDRCPQQFKSVLAGESCDIPEKEAPSASHEKVD